MCFLISSCNFILHISCFVVVSVIFIFEVYNISSVPHVQRSGVSFRCNGTEDKISECYRKGRDTVNGNCSTLAVGCRRLVSKFLN